MKVGEIVKISNLNKKCTIQTEIFKHSEIEDPVYVETIWRGGDFEITLMSDWEVETLKGIEEGQYELETDDFKDCKLLQTYDGQSVEVSEAKFLSQNALYEAGYECVKEYYIIYDGIKLTSIN